MNDLNNFSKQIIPQYKKVIPSKTLRHYRGSPLTGSPNTVFALRCRSPKCLASLGTSQTPKPLSAIFILKGEVMIMTRKTFIILLLAVTIFAGCAHMQVQQRKRELESMLNPLLGKSKKDVVLVIGVPTRTQRIGDLEVYQYYQSYGARGNVWVTPNEYLSTAGARTWEAYDKINIYFEDGIMIKWDGYIQR